MILSLSQKQKLSAVNAHVPSSHTPGGVMTDLQVVRVRVRVTAAPKTPESQSETTGETQWNQEANQKWLCKGTVWLLPW